MRWPVRTLMVLLVLATSACGTKPDHFESHPLGFEQLQGWSDDNHAEALASFLSSCPMLMNKPRSATSGSHLQVDAATWRSLCTDAAGVPRDNNIEARGFFERRFVPYKIANNGKERGLFTGYYVPTLYASHKRKGHYTYALYQPPAGLERMKPYYSHEEIARGALESKGLELVWVDDPVMLFFLQIQGSGRVKFDDGSDMLVGYAGQNGHGYVSLGKIMGDEGLLPKDQINFYTIRQWLYDHPDRAFGLMQRNPSYVFFKRLDQQGAVGAAGSVLVRQRSIAVDNKYIPYGLPVFMETDLPATPNGNLTSFHRVLIAQDTGGAIKGPVRADIFFGEGSDAEYLAGFMKGHGVYSLLVPKEIAGQLPAN